MSEVDLVASPLDLAPRLDRQVLVLIRALTTPRTIPMSTNPAIRTGLMDLMDFMDLVAEIERPPCFDTRWR
jgi:hypothetical protein